MQVAAVCFRRKRGEVEFLLVRSARGHWTFPKGHVHENESEWEAATRKAHEEAGAIGEVRREKLATYRRVSRGKERSIAAYLLEVERTEQPLEEEREPSWFTADAALTALPEYAEGVVKEALNAIGGKAHRDLIFVSYSHADERICKEFLKMIRPAARKHALKLWSDQEIEPGANWREEIEKALARARIGVLLVSPDFLESEFITKNELPPLLNAAAAEGVCISWIACRHSNVNDTEIGKFQALMPPEKPLAARAKAAREKELQRISQRLLRMSGG